MDSKTLIRAKTQVKDKLKSNLLSQYSHYLIPGHIKNQSNLNVNEEFSNLSLSEMFQAFPYNSEFPKPLLPPNKIHRDCNGKEDSSFQLIYTKAKIQDDVNRYLELYKKHSSILSKVTKTEIKWTKKDRDKCTTLPRYLAETAEILECDPDPDFAGSYNWYYGGGTLNSITYDSTNILIFPYAKELITLPVKLKEDSILIPDFKRATKIQIKETLLQTVCSLSNINGRILVRSKNNCFIFSLFNLNKTKLDLLEIVNQSSDIPYISADLDQSNVNKYCTLNVNRKIDFWDINKSKCFLKGNIPVTRFVEDSWSSIKYDEFDINILKYVDRHCIFYYDTRLPIERSSLTMCPKDNLEDCEYLSAYISSTKSQYFSYVGSNHSLCLLDSRYCDKPVVKKWTHQFKSSPLFIDVCSKQNQEFVIFASQLAGEKAIVLNNWYNTENLPESYSTPFTPPSNIETLKALHTQGKCLNPHMRNRMLLCNIGCKTIIDTPNEDVFLLTQNSLKDIFYQGIGHTERLQFYSLENCKSLYKLKLWERQILKNNDYNIVAPITITKRTNAKNIFRSFTNRKLCNTATEENQNTSFEFSPQWKRSVAELNSFVDIFAPELLAPWEMIEDKPLVPTVAGPHQKVLSWLEMSEKNTGETPCKEKNNFETPFIEIQPPIINQNQDLHITHDNESIQELLLPKVKSQNTPGDKKNKKRSVFTPGF